MKVAGIKITAEHLLLAGIAVPIAYAAFRAAKVVDNAADTVEGAPATLGNWIDRRINPASPDNYANVASSSVIARLSGGRYLSLGDYLYSMTHPLEEIRNAREFGTPGAR